MTGDPWSYSYAFFAHPCNCLTGITLTVKWLFNFPDWSTTEAATFSQSLWGQYLAANWRHYLVMTPQISLIKFYMESQCTSKLSDTSPRYRSLLWDTLRNILARAVGRMWAKGACNTCTSKHHLLKALDNWTRSTLGYRISTNGTVLCPLSSKEG